MKLQKPMYFVYLYLQQSIFASYDNLGCNTANLDIQEQVFESCFGGSFDVNNAIEKLNFVDSKAMQKALSRMYALIYKVKALTDLIKDNPRTVESYKASSLLIFKRFLSALSENQIDPRSIEYLKTMFCEEMVGVLKLVRFHIRSYDNLHANDEDYIQLIESDDDFCK